MISPFRNCPVLRSFSVDNIRIGKKVPSTFSASLMNLCLCKNGTLFDDHILYLAKKLTSLRTLNIQHCRALTDRSLQHLAEHAGERLQVLYTDIKNPGCSETKPFLTTLSQKCNVLSYLNINCGEKVLCSGRGTCLLVCGCPELRTLVVNKYSTITKSSRSLVEQFRPQIRVFRHSIATEYDILSMPIV